MIDFHELQQRDLQAIGQQKQRLQRLVLLRSASFPVSYTHLTPAGAT